MASSVPCTYEIHLRGLLGDTLLIAFPGLRSETHSNVTVLTGTLVDQAALHGVLAEIGALVSRQVDSPRNSG
jgi:hypothetical protein